MEELIACKLSRRRWLRLVGLAGTAAVGQAIATACQSAPPAAPAKPTEVAKPAPAEQAPSAKPTAAPAKPAVPAEQVKPAATQAAPAAKVEAKPSAAGKIGGTLTIGRQTDVISFDSYQATSVSTRQVYENLFDHLVITDPRMNLQPAVAESWRQTDPVTYEFALRSGVKFHDGTDLDAEVVKFAFDRLLGFLPNTQPGRPSAFLTGIKEVQAKDARTLVMVAKSPYGPFLNDLTPSWVVIPSPTAVKQLGDQFGTQPVGSGPFKLADWKKDQEVTIVRNEAYWAGPPPLEKVVFRTIPDDSTRLLALQSGEVDMIYQPPSHEVERLRNDRDHQIIEGPTFRTYYIGMNVKKEPFTDPKVRQAMALAINRQEIVDFVMEGTADAAAGLMTPSVFGAPEIGAYEQNLDRVRQLLTEAGWSAGAGGTLAKDGKPLAFQFWASQLQPEPKLAEAVQSMLRKIGAEAEIKTWENAALLAAWPKGDHEMFTYGYGVSTGDADVMIYPHFHSKQPFPTSRRYSFYEDAELDRLIDAARTDTDPEKRKALYRQIHEKVRDVHIIVPVFHTKDIFAAKKYVKGFVTHPGEHIRLWNTWLDK